jgi:hypothetical protein
MLFTFSGCYKTFDTQDHWNIYIQLQIIMEQTNNSTNIKFIPTERVNKQFSLYCVGPSNTIEIYSKYGMVWKLYIITLRSTNVRSTGRSNGVTFKIMCIFHPPNTWRAWWNESSNLWSHSINRIRYLSKRVGLYSELVKLDTALN